MKPTNPFSAVQKIISLNTSTRASIASLVLGLGQAIYDSRENPDYENALDQCRQVLEYVAGGATPGVDAVMATLAEAVERAGQR